MLATEGTAVDDHQAIGELIAQAAPRAACRLKSTSSGCGSRARDDARCLASATAAGPSEPSSRYSRAVSVEVRGEGGRGCDLLLELQASRR